MADGLGLPLKKPPGYIDPTPRPRPPPTGPKPAFYQPKKKKNSCCRICCCCVCFVIVFLILILAIGGGIFYAWFQPKIPVFGFRPLELDRFNISVKPDGTALLDSKAVVRVEAKNPNSKLEIYFGETEVSLSFDKETQLGSATLSSFVQPSNNVTLLKFVLSEENQLIDSSTGTRLKKRVKNEDVEVNVAVKTKIGIGVWKVKIGMLPINVNCGGITLKQLDDGQTSPKCSFNTLRW
ncbi:NDR1/HIN1-like protein 6 [Silene latifolia]|uniref:NDR1/HIN1-like protein 6 n=1 Tax=Silene latifolia TaxID=37657 RepID=UPI003D780E9B